jgi:hypothetical protein
MNIWPRRISVQAEYYTEAFSHIAVTFYSGDPAPDGPPDVGVNLTTEQLESLILDIYKATKEVRPIDFVRGYKAGRSSVQFPVCACEFDDDQDTLIRPCLAHKEWAASKNER